CLALSMATVGTPIVLQNNSVPSVVLDCVYHYEEYEAKGLTVKWFWHKDHEPVYQWIPGGTPEVRGILTGRVAVDHIASSDFFSRHRALSIIRPTSDLSGLYTCTVSTYYDEKRYSLP
ncbi:Immunoglobulin-like domain, partial [Trinorchestia longiramus]